MRRARTWLCLATAGVISLALAAPAAADPQWRLDSLSDTTVAPGGTLEYLVQGTNVGDRDMDGRPIELLVRLPSGMTARSATHVDWSLPALLSCTAGDGVSPVAGASTVLCRNTSRTKFVRNSTSNFQQLTLVVDVDSSASGELLTAVDLSGGGAASVSTVDPVTVTTDPPAFGFDAFDGEVVSRAGTPYTQAGGRPYAATVALDFNTSTSSMPLEGALWPVEPIRDVFVDLPPGLIGNPTAADRCTPAELTGGGGLANQTFCPPSSQVGTTVVRLRPSDRSPAIWGPLPVFNLVPPPNVPARFGFNLLGSIVVFDGELRSGGDYGLSVNVRNIPEALGVAGTSVTFWGNPASSDHDFERACPGANPPSEGGPVCQSGGPQKAFLRNPTSCTAPGVGLPVTARIDSWDNPGVFREATWLSHVPPGYPFPPGRDQSNWGPQVGPTNCERVPFAPTLDADPLTRQAGKPSGFQFDLTLPQSDSPDPNTPGTADLRTAVVTLPLGVRVSPSSANGLGACSPAEIAYKDSSVPRCPDA